MVEIGGTQIDAHWLEYAAEVEPGKIVECASLAEARALGGRVLLRHVYETAYESVNDAAPQDATSAAGN